MPLMKNQSGVMTDGMVFLYDPSLKQVDLGGTNLRKNYNTFAQKLQNWIHFVNINTWELKIFGTFCLKMFCADAESFLSTQRKTQQQT